MNTKRIKVGDMVLVHSRSSLSKDVVTRETATQLITQRNGKFRKKDWFNVGGDAWTLVNIKPFDEAAWTTYQARERLKRRTQALYRVQWGARDEKIINAVWQLIQENA